MQKYIFSNNHKLHSRPFLYKRAKNTYEWCMHPIGRTICTGIHANTKYTL